MELVEYPRQLRRRNSSYNRYLKKVSYNYNYNHIAKV